MGLESASYISELTATNPIGASDPKSQGDDHIRLIKTAILNSFGGFVGTAGTPKSITLTEDELNDCAQKAAAATIAGLWNFTTVPTINGNLVGHNKLRQRVEADNYEFVLADAGRHVIKRSGGAGETYTIPANASVAFEVGDVITVVNNGGGDLSIAITTDTLTLEGEGTTGTRTLADGGIATLLKTNTTQWMIMGGLSLS